MRCGEPGAPGPASSASDGGLRRCEQAVNDPTGTVQAAPGPAGAGPLVNGHRASPAGSPARDLRQLSRAASPGLTQGAP